MEKRLFLAFALSFIVLAVWGVLNPRPQPARNGLGLTQPVENKEDIVHPTMFSKSQPADQETKRKRTVPETLEILENDKLIAEFSNIGGALKNVVIKEHAASLPVTNIFIVSEYEMDEFVLDEITGTSISYSLKKDGLRITKRYDLGGNDYIVKAGIEVQNLAIMSSKNNMNIKNFSLDISRLDKKLRDRKNESLFEYSVSNETKVYRKSNAFKFSEKESKKELSSVKWTGFRDRYFCAVIKPLYTATGFQISAKSNERLDIDVVASVPRETGEIMEYESIIYIGPQKLDILRSYDIGIEDIMKFSNWGLLDSISKGIYRFMDFMHSIIPNWGICIILISFIIYGAMYPLTMKGMLSMKRMQALQPKITKLRDAHKSNPQKLNKEIMTLYKEHKVNPLGGCFPLLLQMPIFIGLYQVLWRSVSFKGAGFLWIKDLSEPDRLLIFPFTLPVIGNELNILPIIMVVVMAIQQKISAKNMTITDPSQAAQQKIMMTVFPIFLGFIFYKFASGLSLYFTIFYLMSTFTQWKMSKVVQVVK